MNFLSNLRVKSKLMLGFAAMATVTAVVSVLAVKSLGQSNDRFHTYIEGVENRQTLAIRIRGAAYSRAVAARNLVLVTSPVDRDAEKQAVTQAHEEMDHALGSLKQAITADATVSAQDREFLAELERVEAKYGPVALSIVDMALKGNHVQAIAKMNAECRPLLAQLIKISTAYLDYNNGLAAVEVKQAASRFAIDRTLLVAACVIAVSAAIALGWLLSRVVTRPLMRAVELAEAVAAGDLRSAVVVEGKDETAQLLAALQRMNASLSEMVAGVRRSADGIATASQQIASGNQDLSSRTEHQASALQQTASSMQQMTTTVQQNADSSRQANQLAGSAAGVAVEGGEVVQRVVSTMGEITESSRRIGDIIGVIDSIAFQTNILALNAAVEAARAGEQGRGFAVVASEVRSLAQRSANAAKEIKTLIGVSVDKVQAGSALVGEAGHTMTEVVAQVRRVSDLVAKINAATSEQSTGIGQVNQAVASIDQGTQQNAALVEESAAAAESLKRQAAGLLESIARFKTRDSVAA